MQQFVVPQFIDVEAKILGPLTVRQFLIFLFGFGLIFIVFKLASFWMAAIEGVLIFALTGTFAFLKINGRPPIPKVSREVLAKLKEFFS